MTSAFTLAEHITMLAYRRDTHTLTARRGGQPASMSRTIVAAMLVELIETKQIAIVARTGFMRDDFTLERSAFRSTGNASLDQLLAAIEEPGNANKPLSWWVSFSGVTGTVLADLDARGVIVSEHKKLGFLRSSHEVRIVDPVLDAELHQYFEAVFLGSALPSDRDHLLAAVISGGDTWHYFAPLDDRTAATHFFERVQELAGRYELATLGRSADARTRSIARVLDALMRVNAPSS